MAPGSVTISDTRIKPRHLGQTVTSALNTRLSSHAQGCRLQAYRFIGGGCGARSPLRFTVHSSSCWGSVGSASSGARGTASERKLQFGASIPWNLTMWKYGGGTSAQSLAIKSGYLFTRVAALRIRRRPIHPVRPSCVLGAALKIQRVFLGRRLWAPRSYGRLGRRFARGRERIQIQRVKHDGSRAIGPNAFHVITQSAVV